MTAAEDVLTADDDLAAFFCINDMGAFDVYRPLRQQAKMTSRFMVLMVTRTSWDMLLTVLLQHLQLSSHL